MDVAVTTPVKEMAVPVVLEETVTTLAATPAMEAALAKDAATTTAPRLLGRRLAAETALAAAQAEVVVEATALLPAVLDETCPFPSPLTLKASRRVAAALANRPVPRTVAAPTVVALAPVAVGVAPTAVAAIQATTNTATVPGLEGTVARLAVTRPMGSDPPTAPAETASPCPVVLPSTVRRLAPEGDAEAVHTSRAPVLDLVAQTALLA